jgi:hypothetical protein
VSSSSNNRWPEHSGNQSTEQEAPGHEAPEVIAKKKPSVNAEQELLVNEFQSNLRRVRAAIARMKKLKV